MPVLTNEEIQAIAELERRGVHLSEGQRNCLWPSEFAEDTPECLWKFVLTLATWNEAEGQIQNVPDLLFLKVYVYEWWYARKGGYMLVTLKCRRMMISWVARACELWAMGLRRTDEILVGEKLQQAAKHIWRIQFLYDFLRSKFLKWNLPKMEHLRYQGERELSTVSLPNGSRAVYANGEDSTVRGDGTAIVTMEEAATYRYLSQILAQAKIITQGSAGSIGGFVNVITNQVDNWDFSQIEKTQIPAEPIIECKGIDVYGLSTGGRFLVIHYYADPAKDYTWLKKIEAEMADTPEEFRREILLDKTVRGGEPVYPNYNDEWHCPPKFRRLNIPIIDGSIYFGGWDGGMSLTPAFSLYQVTMPEFQVHAIMEVTSTGSEPMELFAPRVMYALMKKLPGEWDQVRHFADETFRQRSGGSGETAAQVAAKHGFPNMTMVSNRPLSTRIGAVTWLLGRQIGDGHPSFMIDGKACPMLWAGFQGAYKLKASTAGKKDGPEMILLEPDKNMYSHVCDSGQYACVGIRRMVEGSGNKAYR